MNQEDIERVCRMLYEAMRTHRIIIGESYEGDEKALPWDSTPAWVKGEVKRTVIACLAAGSNLTPDFVHSLWAYEKTLDGWTYDASLDLDAKTHPCFVSYPELDDISREKNRLVCAIIRAMRG